MLQFEARKWSDGVRIVTLYYISFDLQLAQMCNKTHTVHDPVTQIITDGERGIFEHIYYIIILFMTQSI